MLTVLIQFIHRALLIAYKIDSLPGSCLKRLDDFSFSTMAGSVHNRCLLNLFLKTSWQRVQRLLCTSVTLCCNKNLSMQNLTWQKVGMSSQNGNTRLKNGEKAKKKFTSTFNFVRFLGKLAWKCKVLTKYMHNQYVGKSIFVFIHLQWTIFTKRETRKKFNKKICSYYPHRKEACFTLHVEKYIKIIIFIVNVMHLSTF